MKQQVELQRDQEQQEQQEGEEREEAEDSDDGFLEEDPSLSGDNSDAGGPLLETIARETEHDVQVFDAEQ